MMRPVGRGVRRTLPGAGREERWEGEGPGQASEADRGERRGQRRGRRGGGEAKEGEGGWRASGDSYMSLANLARVVLHLSSACPGRGGRPQTKQGRVRGDGGGGREAGRDEAFEGAIASGAGQEGVRAAVQEATGGNPFGEQAEKARTRGRGGNGNEPIAVDGDVAEEQLSREVEGARHSEVSHLGEVAAGKMDR